MKPLYVLLGTFVASLAAIRLLSGVPDYKLAGRIALSVMLLFTAVGHFVFSRGMSMMLPGFVPFKRGLVFLTGFAEIAAAAGLLIPLCRQTTAWLLIGFFLIILPANISAALRHIDYQKGTSGGPGRAYLWLRVPLQALFIAWVYWCGVR